jgi:hypothetical protein
LEAQVAQFNAQMAAATKLLNQVQKSMREVEKTSELLKEALSQVKMTQRQAQETGGVIDSIQRSLEGARKSAIVARDALKDVKLSTTQAAETTVAADVEVRDLKKIRDAALEAAAAEKLVGMGPMTESQFRSVVGSRQAAAAQAVGALRDTEALNAALKELQVQTRQGGRFSTNAIPLAGASRQVMGNKEFYDYVAQLAKSQGAKFGPMTEDEFKKTIGSRRFGFDRPLEPNPVLRDTPGLGRGDIKGAERFLKRLGFGIAGGNVGTRGPGGGGGGGDGFGGASSFFRGILPGGRRAGAGAVVTGLGLLAGAGPAAVPAAGGLAIGAAGAMTALVGAAATLKLAFADMSAAAFTSKAAFDQLTPAQQSFVLTLKSLDAGVMKPLENIAQQNLFPKLTMALHSLISPTMIGAVQKSVGSFATNIGRGAENVAGLLGSNEFSRNFQKVMVADSLYVNQFITDIGKLVDSFFRILAVGKPFTDWLSGLGVKFSDWVQSVTKSTAANGQMAQFFDHAKQGLQVIGALLRSLAHIAGAFGDAFGFKNSIMLLQTFQRVFQMVADLIKANKNILHDLFSGALQAINDVLTAIGPLLGNLTKLLSLLNKIAHVIGGWRVVFDAVIIAFSAKMLLGISRTHALNTALVGTGAAAKRGATGVEAAMVADSLAIGRTAGILAGFKASLLGMARLAIPVAITLSLIPGNAGGQAVLDAAGVGGAGHLPVVGGAAQWLGAFANSLRGALGEQSLLPPNEKGTFAQRFPVLGELMGTSGVGLSNVARLKNQPESKVVSELMAQYNTGRGQHGGMPPVLAKRFADYITQKTTAQDFETWLIQHPGTYSGFVQLTPAQQEAATTMQTTTAAPGKTQTAKGFGSLSKTLKTIAETPGLLMNRVLEKASVLPASIQREVDQAAWKGPKAQERAYNDARAYYLKLQRLPGLTPTQKQMIQNAGSIYAAPDPFAQTGGGAIGFTGPTTAGGAVFNAQTAVQQAMTTGSGSPFSQQLSLAKQYEASAAAAYKHLKDQKVAAADINAKQSELTTLLKDEAQARQYISRITANQAKAMAKAVDDARKGQIAQHQTTISAIRSNLISRVSAAATPGEALAAISKALLAASSQYAQLWMFNKKLLSQTNQTSQLKAEENQLRKEMNATLGIIHTAEKDQAKALKAQDAAKLEKRWERIFGITKGDTSSVESVTRRERSTLLGLVHDISRTSARHLRGAVTSTDKYAAIPGAPNMSIVDLIKSLQAHGVHFTKRALEDFAMINKYLAEVKKHGAKVATVISDKITALLTQIEQNTNPRNKALPTYHLASLKTVMSNLTAIKDPAKRKAAAEKLLEMEIYGGMLPKVHSIAGIPIFHSGRNVLPTHSTHPAHLGVGPHSRQLQSAKGDIVSSVWHAATKAVHNIVHPSGGGWGAYFKQQENAFVPHKHPDKSWLEFLSMFIPGGKFSRVFHGTGRVFDKYDLNAPINVGKQYGKGIYMTDNPRAASSYAETHGGGVPNIRIHQVDMSKLFDMNARGAKEVAQLRRQLEAAMPPSILRAVQAKGRGEGIYRTSGGKPGPFSWAGQDSAKGLMEIIHNVFADSLVMKEAKGARMSDNAFHARIDEMTNAILKKAGFTGLKIFREFRGVKSGDAKGHEIVVFDPKDIHPVHAALSHATRSLQSATMGKPMNPQDKATIAGYWSHKRMWDLQQNKWVPNVNPKYNSEAAGPVQVTIHINGYNKDKQALAAEVRDVLLKTRRRNAPQTRGINGGRSVGLS